jgi:hypothetical protein
MSKLERERATEIISRPGIGFKPSCVIITAVPYSMLVLTVTKQLLEKLLIFLTSHLFSAFLFYLAHRKMSMKFENRNVDQSGLSNSAH